MCEDGIHSFCSSDILQLENDRNPQAKRKEFAGGILKKASETIEIDDEIGSRAKELEKQGFKAFDALPDPSPVWQGRIKTGGPSTSRVR
jgi:hypothetical protein